MRWTVTVAVLFAVLTPIRAQEPAFVPLFSGDSLTGWVAEHTDQLRATDGVLRTGDRTGWLRTDRSTFAQFRLRFDIQGSSSTTRVLLGLFGRVPGNGAPVSAFVIPLLGREAPPDAALRHMRLQMLVPSRTAVASAVRGPDEWQSYEVVHAGRDISVTLNGSVVMIGSGPAAIAGWIGFLADGGGIALRNIRIEELPEPSVLTGGIYKAGNGVSPPEMLKDARPQYTSDAMRAKVVGSVVLECVVQVDGTVGDVHIVRSLDPTFGLDEEAVKAAKQWLFRPGIRMGEAVPVLVTIELTFTLGR